MSYCTSCLDLFGPGAGPPPHSGLTLIHRRRTADGMGWSTLRFRCRCCQAELCCDRDAIGEPISWRVAQAPERVERQFY